MKLGNFFGLTLSLCCPTWVNNVIVVDKWHHLLLNWSPISPVFTRIFSLPPGFCEKNEKSVMLSVLSVLIGRSTQRFLPTGDVSMSWLAHRALTRLCQQQCLQVTPSVGSSSRWDGAVYSAATFPASVWSQFKLDSQERTTTNEIKHEPEQTAVCFPKSLMLQLTLAC